MKVKYIKLSYKEARWIIHILSDGKFYYFDSYIRSVVRLLSSKFPPGSYEYQDLVTSKEEINKENKRNHQKINSKKKKDL